MIIIRFTRVPLTIISNVYMKEGGGRGGGAGFSSPMDMFNMMFGGGMGGKDSTILCLF